MSKRAAVRHAIYTVHGEKCYMCHAPLNLQTMEIDHVIPQTLADEPSRLAKVLAELGRPADFDVNSYENMSPACGPCNSGKSNIIWESSLLIQLHLQKAKAKAADVEALTAKTLRERYVANALNTLERAREDGLTDDTIKVLWRYQTKVREPEQAIEPLRLTPSIRVIYLTAPVGFTEKTLDLFRSHEHVHAIIDAKRSADGRYHDIWLQVTDEFADFVVAYARTQAELH
jgi:hypothetical protein